MKLPVRSCRIVAEDGSTAVDHVVQCPRRGESIPLLTCLACAERSAISVAPRAANGMVECLAPGEPAPPRRVDVAEAAIRVRLGDVVGAEVVCVRSDVDLDGIASLFVERKVRAVPVVDDDRCLVGVASKTDLLRDLLAPPADLEGPPPRRTVADIMSPVVHGLPEDAPVAYAISLMATESVHEVPVVDREGRVVGMLTATDALRWVAQAMGYVMPTTKG
jgi:CBS domain-containing protein